MAYKYMAEVWRKPNSSYIKDLMQRKVIKWRKQPAIVRIDKPTRFDRARRLGYKDKTGYVSVRVRVRRGGLNKRRPRAGRRQKRMGVVKYKPAKSFRLIAEERAARKYPNLEVLNSYWIWEDGVSKWYEVLLVDRNILTKVDLGKGSGRVHRGLTGAGRKMRHLV